MALKFKVRVGMLIGQGLQFVAYSCKEQSAAATATTRTFLSLSSDQKNEGQEWRCLTTQQSCLLLFASCCCNNNNNKSRMRYARLNRTRGKDEKVKGKAIGKSEVNWKYRKRDNHVRYMCEPKEL